MAKELQFFSDTSWLTIVANIFLDDSVVGNVTLSEWSNKVYVWDMPKLWYWEYAVEFFDGIEMVWFGTIMWSWEYEYNLGNIPTGWMGSSFIDTTQSHEDILKKYDIIIKKELKSIIDSIKIPTIDIWPIERAIQWIKPADISGFMQGISDIKSHIKNLSENVVKEYEKKKAEIEMKYRDEIEKKNSLLRENEYTLSENKKYIETLKENVATLEENIDEIKEEKEEELKMMEDTYQKTLKNSEVTAKNEIAQKILTFIEK